MRRFWISTILGLELLLGGTLGAKDLQGIEHEQTSTAPNVGLN